MNLALALIVATTTSSTSLSDSPWSLSDRVEDVRFRIAAGGEWDTNARRSVEGAEASERTRPLEGDSLVRVVVDTSGRLRLARNHKLAIGYLLGAKRFFGVSSQDLLAHELSIESQHALLDRLSLSFAIRGRSHRVRSDTVRNYDLGLLSTAITFHIDSATTLEASGRFSGYRYPEQPFFSYWSPSAQATFAWLPSRRWELSASAGYAYRDYSGPGLVQTFSVDTQGNRLGPFPTFCVGADSTEECTRMERFDDEFQAGAGVVYRGRFLATFAVFLGVQYLLRVQRSTSDYENVNRHRASMFATVGLPAAFTMSLLVALQFNDGVSITDTLTLAEDDENRNAIQAKLSRRFSDTVSVELRYALFANQFSTTDFRYLRQTVYLGVTFETGL